jgi:hypothetical protein
MASLSSSNRILGFIVGGGLLALTGCAEAGEQAAAEAVVASALETHQNGAVGKDVAEPSDCTLDPEAAAQAIAARPSAAFIPSSCVQKTADGNTLHVELDDCSGRFGKARVNGGLDATLTSSAECSVHAEIVDSGNLEANGRKFEYQASADIVRESDHENVAWQAEWSGTTRRGYEIHQTSDFDLVTHPSGCVDANGTAKGEVNGRDYDIDVNGLSVCPDACPTSGTVHGRIDGRFRDRDLTITFDGTTAAHVVGWSGRNFDVTMDCEPASAAND